MEKIIRVKNLTKKFKDFVAVDHISFDVGLGEIFAFLGPNGAGKTTTIKMLTTLLAPTDGTMSLNGASPVDDPNRVRESFGIVFQDQSLDEELTAYENLHFHGVLYRVPKDEMSKRITELLTIVELTERKDSLVKTFSGGMRRRLEIARGLLHRPKVFFLDEPTLGLDPQTRNRIWAYIRKLNAEQHITIFFTTHYMEEAEKMANRIAVIDHGKIVALGTAEQLKKQTGKPTLEEAFIDLTGHEIRQESATSADTMRMARRMWGGRS